MVAPRDKPLILPIEGSGPKSAVIRTTGDRLSLAAALLIKIHPQISLETE